MVCYRVCLCVYHIPLYMHRESSYWFGAGHYDCDDCDLLCHESIASAWSASGDVSILGGADSVNAVAETDPVSSRTRSSRK